MMSSRRPEVHSHFAADNRLVQRTLAINIVCPLSCAAAWTSFAIIRGIRLFVIGHVSPKIAYFCSGSSPPRNSVPRAMPTRHPKLHFDRFSRFCNGAKCYAVQCQWGRKPQKLPRLLGISSPRRKRTEPRP